MCLILRIFRWQCTYCSRIHVHFHNFTKFWRPLTKFKNTFKRSAAPVPVIIYVQKANRSHRHTVGLTIIPRVLGRPWQHVRRQRNLSGCRVRRWCLHDGRRREKILSHFEIQQTPQAERKHSGELTVGWTQNSLLRINNLKLKFPVINAIFYCRIFIFFFVGTSVALPGDGSVPCEESNVSDEKSDIFA